MVSLKFQPSSEDDVVARIPHRTSQAMSMYGEAASNWAVCLYSLFDPTNVLPFFPSVWNERALGNSRYPNNARVRDTDVLVGYLVLFWSMLYLLYETCLNVSKTRISRSSSFALFS